MIVRCRASSAVVHSAWRALIISCWLVARRALRVGSRRDHGAITAPRVQVPCKRLQHYSAALTHASALGAGSASDLHAAHEALSHAGASVLRLTLRRLLLAQFPGATPGDLSLMEGWAMAHQVPLYQIALCLEVDKYVAMSVPVRCAGASAPCGLRHAAPRCLALFCRTAQQAAECQSGLQHLQSD